MSTVIFEARLEDGCVALDARGAVDLATQERFEATVVGNLALAPVVLDLSGVDFFAISALGALLRCEAAAEALGHPLVLTRPRSLVLLLLELAGVDRRVRLERVAAPERPGRPEGPLVSFGAPAGART